MIGKIKSGLVKIVLGGALALGVAGCESMTEEDAAVLALRGYGMQPERTYEEASSAELMAGFLSEGGRRKYEIKKEKIGKDTVIIINQGYAQPKEPLSSDDIKRIFGEDFYDKYFGKNSSIMDDPNFRKKYFDNPECKKYVEEHWGK